MPPDLGPGVPEQPASLRSELPLAYGPLQPADAAELDRLKQVIQQTVGLDIESYKEPCLRRRIAVRMRARALHRYADYAAVLNSDPNERHLLLDAVTINVSKFYRNPEVWRVIEQNIVPALFEARAPKIRIWSAGCASGEEPYTIAMVLRHYAQSANLSRKLHKFDILATDVDPGVLELAARAEYGPFAFGDIEQAMRDQFFDHGTTLKPEVKRMVRFGTLDLMNDEFPKHQHLIFCRNVIIYFERAVQEKLFRKFHAALAPGGHLVLGQVETIFGAAAGLFTAVSARERIFCKA